MTQWLGHFCNSILTDQSEQRLDIFEVEIYRILFRLHQILTLYNMLNRFSGKLLLRFNVKSVKIR